MPTPKQMITRILFDKAQELHDKPRTIVTFTTLMEPDALLNNIEQYPHFFVLGCIMNRQIPTERAWNIPCIISKNCGGPEFGNFLSLNITDLNLIFSEKRLHRFNEQMANNFHRAIQIIHTKYRDNAANIWLDGQHGCKEVIDRFAQFPGVGQKISTMATNILVREFKVPLSNVHEIDISVDSQIRKVFKRMGLVSVNASDQHIIEVARKIYPKYPGLADSVIWEIGRDWCKPDLSVCHKCYLNEYCPKNPISDVQSKNLEDSFSRKTRIVTNIKSQTESLAIEPGKYRPRFEEIIRLYDEIKPNTVRVHGTSSKTNWVIKANNLPEDLHFEFHDWNDKFSVEICLETARLPEKEAIFRQLTKKNYQNLPDPVFISQTNNWLRLLFYFRAEIPAVDIARAMNVLIDQSYPILNDEAR